VVDAEDDCCLTAASVGTRWFHVDQPFIDLLQQWFGKFVVYVLDSKSIDHLISFIVLKRFGVDSCIEIKFFAIGWS
jgi:hypothetical protein